MAESTVPGPGPVTVQEANFEALTHPAGGDGWIGTPGGPAPIYADGSGLQVKVRAGVAALVRGSLYRQSTTDLAIPITANASGQTRIDRIVVRLDRATWLTNATAIDGTPGGSAPAPVQDAGSTGVWDLLGVKVTVADGAVVINGGDVTREDFYIGETPILYTTSTRPSVGLKLGQLGYDSTLKQWQFWDGTQWTTLVPATVANSTKWNSFQLAVQQTTPSGSPTSDRIWIQPT